MSTTRFIKYGLENIQLQKLQPTKMLYIKSCPCEEQTAYIRNTAVNAIEIRDVAEIARRYNQSCRGQRNTFAEVIIWFLGVLVGILSSSKLYHETKNPDRDANQDIYMYALIVITLLGSIQLLVMILPNIPNTLRHRETKNGCRMWLERNLSSEQFKKIGNLPKSSYKRESFRDCIDNILK